MVTAGRKWGLGESTRYHSCHDIFFVLCAYLGSDLTRLRASGLLGSLVPLLALLVWDAIALCLLNRLQAEQIADPVELLKIHQVLGTSMIGTLLGFSEFFKQQLKNFSWHSSSMQGGYCMTMLYGVLPPAMAWAMQNREDEDSDQKVLTRARPALFGVGLFECGLVVEQIVQDFFALRF
ncbi:hypothetical protein DITRI_Ditri09bG0108500 [Diplodiscus trichospermus]